MSDKFIEKAIEIHGDKYDYSLVEYKNTTTKVKIICTIHGEWEQIPKNHLKGHGCFKCGRDKLRTTPEDFIKKAIEVHGDKYDYSLVKYKNAGTKIKIICKIHEEFEQEPRCHLSGDGCKKCADKNQIKTTEQFIKEVQKIHGEKYDYSLVDYIGVLDKVIIICKIHGKFEQTPANQLAGSGCRKCITDQQKKTTEQFIEEAQKIHGDKYDYSLVVYITVKDKITIICNIHGSFEQTPDAHLNKKTGCSQCTNKTEGKVKEFLVEHDINFETQYKVGNKKFDFLINDKYILEIDGSQHFPYSNFKQNDSIPIRKRIETLNNDVKKIRSVIDTYPVVRLFQEHIWLDKYNWKDLLINLNDLESNTLYVRFEEEEIYRLHTSNFNVEYLSI